MTLVLLGTQNNDFHRLLEEIEKNIENGNITDDVVVQAGFTKFYSDKMKIFSMTSKENLDKMVEKADLIITHAGMGSIEMSLEKGKKVIAVPRKKIYGEHVNDHQKDIAQEYNKKGWIIGIDDVENLNIAIKKSKYFIPNEYKENKNSDIMYIIQQYIEKN